VVLQAYGRLVRTLHIMREMRVEPSHAAATVELAVERGTGRRMEWEKATLMELRFPDE
jgi:hypothetical protein